jgi:ABC-type multidrug transport system permease subunit
VRFVWISALKDLRRLRRDPVALGLWIGIPLFVVLLMYVMFGRGETRPQGRLLVSDEDATLLSGLVVGAFRQGRLAEMLRVEKLPREQAQEQMRGGKASAWLIIPQGFARALLRNEASRLTLVTNPAQRILPGIIEESVSILVEGAFYLHALAEDELRTLAEGPPGEATAFPDAIIAELSVRFSRMGPDLARWLDPPRIQLETQIQRPSSATRANFGALFAPGVVFLALLFIALGLSGDFWKERSLGTLRRVRATPHSTVPVLGGKLLAASIIFFAVSLAGLGGASLAADIRAAAVLPGALWSAAAGTVLFLLLALIRLYASSARAAHVLANLVIFPMMLLGGSFFPLEVMPDSLARIGRWTPNGWALVQLKAILTGAVEPARLAAAAALPAAVGAAAFLLAARRLRSFA